MLNVESKALFFSLRLLIYLFLKQMFNFQFSMLNVSIEDIKINQPSGMNDESEAFQPVRAACSVKRAATTSTLAR